MIHMNLPNWLRHRLQTRTTIVSMMLLTFIIPGTVQAQVDVVVTRRKDSEQTLQRKGTIVQWKGMSLTINSNGIEREIENDQIIDVQTNWSDDYLSGLTELKTGKTQIAIVKFQEA